MHDFNWATEQAKLAMQNALNEAGVAGIEERGSLIKKKLHEKQMDSFQQKMISTQAVAMKAIKKELDIEKLLQQEVQLKAMLDTKNLLEQKRLEEKKKRLS